ncbi:MAG: beta-glucuronidase [Anaerolineaceae bacterium]|nr:beta-glucuronidase [Anaerolineaceae bacterium]
MLYPQTNAKRQMIDLSGFWNIHFDPDNSGRFGAGFDGGEIIAVPASWNDQLNDRRDYFGTAWYQTTFSLPWGWRGQRIFVRFNSVNYLADVWLNGEQIGSHEGGHLPFAFDITDRVQDEGNLLVVRVDSSLAPDRVPPGNLNAQPGASFGLASFPDSSFDFFPFCGIQRPVLLYTTPQSAITDVTVTTTIDGKDGMVAVRVVHTADAATLRFSLQGHGATETAESSTNTGTLTVKNAAFWSPQSPNLYTLKVELLQSGQVIDSYALDIGIRTIEVDGDRLLLNGEPVKLLGFGRHEDFPVVGKGLLPALIVKDYELMRWIGANSFRTTHYPYSEQMMQLADRLGFMIIDETPAVGLFFMEPGQERRNALCKQYIREMIDRDKNHPSVIMWSIANEPHTAKPEARQTYYSQNYTVVDHASREAAVQAFREQAELARSLDPTRPLTLVSHEGATEEAWRFVDVISLNRYLGWYSESGRIDAGVERLSHEIDVVHQHFPGPFILTEFGTDTIPGHHAEPPEMFSEEYQVEFLTQYITMMNTKPFVVGQHIWNLCDFKTSQGVIRMGGYNYKGVFTRDRRPKMAAHRVRDIWHKETQSEVY